MKTGTKVAIGVVGVAVVGGGIYALTRKPKKTTKKKNRVEGGDLSALLPVWNSKNAARAKALVQKQHEEAGSPETKSLDKVAKQTAAVMQAMYPYPQLYKPEGFLGWPTTQAGAEKFIRAGKFGSMMYAKVYDLVKDTWNYGPVQ